MPEGEEKPNAIGAKPSRTGRRLFLIAIAIILLGVLLPVANSIRCAFVIPDGFNGSTRGTFSSDTVHLVSGRVFAKTDFEEVLCGETREVEVAIYYDLWSIHCPGQMVRARLACTVYDDHIQGCNVSVPASYDGGARFLARARYPDEPSIRLLAISGRPTVGVYRTSTPRDSGHFCIHMP